MEAEGAKYVFEQSMDKRKIEKRSIEKRNQNTQEMEIQKVMSMLTILIKVLR